MQPIYKTEALETAIRWRIDWRRDGLLFWEASYPFQHVREMVDKGSFPFLFLFKGIVDSNGVHYSLFMRTLLLSVSLTPYCWPNSLKPLLQVDTFTSERSKQSQTKILPVHLVQGIEVSIVVPFHTEDSHLWEENLPGFIQTPRVSSVICIRVLVTLKCSFPSSLRKSPWLNERGSPWKGLSDPEVIW